jgi:hypothetical protein
LEFTKTRTDSSSPFTLINKFNCNVDGDLSEDETGNFMYEIFINLEAMEIHKIFTKIP